MSTDITIHNEDDARQKLAKSGLELPSVIEDAGEHAQEKFIELFLNQIANENTRKAYGRAAVRFFSWCEERGMKLEDITPNHAGVYIRTREASEATVKQHLAGLRRLYDWFVVIF